MSFSSDLWNGFTILKKSFLQTYNKLKHFYEIMLSFASLEKSHSKNLEILYEQNKDLFNTDEIIPIASKTFISNLKLESEYHKYCYNNIFDKILAPLKEILDKRKSVIIKIFCDSMKNTEEFNKIIQNIILKQDNYYNSCKDLSKSLSEIEVYSQNTETKKKPGVTKSLLSKRDKAFEKVTSTQNDYLNIVTESNIILKDYNIKTENLLNDLENEFIKINTCIKDCLLNYSKNKIQLYKDILDMTNHGLNKIYEKIDIENDLKNFVMKNATKEFRYHKFEYNPFKLNNINKNLLFSDIKDSNTNNNIIQTIDYDRVINMVRKFFVDNNITGSDSGYIERMVNKLRKHKLEFSIKYDSITEMNKNNENKNLINEISKNENTNTSANINSSNNINNKLVEKEKEITNNIKFIENFMGKLTSGELDLENDISKVKTILQKNKENFIYLEYIFQQLNNYRSHGNYILKDKIYENFLNLFTFILDNFNNNDFIIKNILTYSQTLYKIRQGNKNPKYYILYSLSNHSIFNKVETWHKIINYSLTNFSTNKDLSVKLGKEDREKRLEDNIFKILVENLAIMKLFRVNDKIFNEVKNYYIQIYNIDKELLRKEVNYYYKENNFSVNEENEKELIKGDNKDYFSENLRKKDSNEIKNEIINKEPILEKKEENIINEANKDKKIEENKIIEENKENNENKIEEKVEEKNEIKIEGKEENKIDTENKVEVKEENKIEEKDEIIIDNKNKIEEKEETKIDSESKIEEKDGTKIEEKNEKDGKNDNKIEDKNEKDEKEEKGKDEKDEKEEKNENIIEEKDVKDSEKEQDINKKNDI